MNRLASEPSPYLRQHADNPVDWYAWGNEAFELARERDVPVLLSVGYSACHWCHVMAHESFEDPVTAEEVNAGFVAVKVDREERPDVDAVYMEAVQAMSGRGGWPMTVFCTPDGRPFFAGTYFPNRDVHGMPSFRHVLAAISQAWTDRRDEIEKQADELSESVRQRASLSDHLLSGTVGAGQDGSGSSTGASADWIGTDWQRVSEGLIDDAVGQIAARFDPRHGGVGGAPKFPQTSLLELCLRHYRYTGGAKSLGMVTTTLGAMAAGGIYDHLGGGFARYSTDETWTVPHFEKMLYDQAGLILTYLHAWQITSEPEYLQVVSETVEYVLRALAAEGSAGLCAAEDADSEGEEGLFYTWTPEEVAAVLDPELTAVASAWYGITERGNFEGRSILRRPLGAPLLRPAEVEKARAQLFEARKKRIRPGRDDKVLTEWNAMFASSLAQAAAATGRGDWARRAEGIGSFLLTDARREDGRLMRSWQDGVPRHLAYASDYAWVVDCFTRLGELTGKASWLEQASKTAEQMLELFLDDATGAIWSTGSDADAILVRPVDLLDDATPSAASVAAAALLRLGSLTGEQKLTRAAERLLALLVPLGSQHPLAVANALGAMALAGGGALEVVVAGDRPDLLECVRKRYEPDVVVAWGERTSSPLWEARPDGSAYVCHQSTCLMPAATVAELNDQLEVEGARSRVTPGVGRPVGWASTPAGIPEGKVSE
jgi:uncharacterized protein